LLGPGAEGDAGVEGEGYRRALEPRPFVFPEDHGPHRGFRDEWWYFTGVLSSLPGAGAPARRFGYQLTIFRQALAPTIPPRASAWATRDVYMAHFAISDLDGPARGAHRFQAHQRFARDGLALAGARSRPFEVWVDDWQMRGPPSETTIFPVRLKARAGADSSGPSGGPEGSIDLSVGEGRGPIPQGDRGLSAKGPEAGNASFYYSCTRLPTRGHLSVDGRAFEVEGESWLDREWSTSALGPALAGWDWLGVQLSDGRDLMMYRLRTLDGAASAQSRVTLIDAGGQPHLFSPPSFVVTPVGGVWVSPRTGARYPAALRLQIPSERIDLTAQPLLEDQELALAVRYWEGAVSIAGNAGGRPIGGSGYLELTGYQ
jgi:predicted secreted hydrolase